jgi:hypothetical protein
MVSKARQWQRPTAGGHPAAPALRQAQCPSHLEPHQPTRGKLLTGNCQRIAGVLGDGQRKTRRAGCMGHMSCLAARDTETTLPVTGPAAARARAFTKDALAAWDLAEFGETAVLLVSETVGNGVRHARSREPGLRLRLRDGICWPARWGVHLAPGGKTVWAELATRTAAAPDASPLSQGVSYWCQPAGTTCGQPWRSGDR